MWPILKKGKIVHYKFIIFNSNVEKVDKLLLQGGLRCFRMFIPI